MAGVYLSSPRSNSGGRYHSVITLLVYGRLDEKTKMHYISSELYQLQAKTIYSCAAYEEET